MRKAILVAVAMLAFVAAPVAAGPVDITSISGVWNNPVGGSGYTGVGTSSITWGGGPGVGSGYDFVAGADIAPAPINVLLPLGTFTHHNNPIAAGSAITAVDLLFGFGTNGLPATVSATFNFNHNETPNALPCPAGSSTVCDDYVTIVQPIVNQLITAGPDHYYFNMVGFSKDGGLTYSNVFQSPENGSNSAEMYGRLRTQPDAIPEPATLLLFGSGLLAAGIRRRTRR